MGFRRFSDVVARAWGELTALLWPGACAACEQACTAGAFCPGCAATLDPMPPACPTCAMPGAPDGARCADCAVYPPPYASARAVYRYGGALASAIVAMKHGKRPELVRALAPLLVPALMGATAGEAGRTRLVAPVPLHPARLRWRGFNQALELLLGARRALMAGHPRGGALAHLLRVERELLVRTRNTPDLGHAGPLERRRRVRGAFAVRAEGSVRDRTVILVDDVLTTGATAGECARVLLGAGAAEVHLVALARAC